MQLNNFKMQSIIVFLVGTLAFASALPSVLVEDEQGQQYHLTPVLSRQRREPQGPQGFGGGFANKGVQSGTVGFANPNGSGGSVGYTHANGYGHDVKLDAMVPVWTNKNRYGETTVNAGAGVSQHIGGWGGTHSTDKRFGLNVNHRF